MKYGLIGKHLSYSFSKEIHEYIAGYNYELIELAPSKLGDFMHKKDFSAINVTIPYKEKVITYLDELSSLAIRVGAVNTVINKNGKLYGDNTDVAGFIALVNKLGVNIKNKKVLILGSGGASKAVKVALEELEAKEILIVSRKKIENAITYSELDEHIDADIIVNTTPVGMYPNQRDELLISLDKFNNLSGVIDLIYNPIRTRLIIEAQNRNIPAIGGLYMLVAQAYYAVEEFLNIGLEENLLEKTYQKIKNEKTNIVLIGMPGSGKTTIGKVLSNRLKMDFLDTDQIIEEDIKMSISNYFKEYSEEEFRKLETEVIKNNYLKTPLVISTGGGIIKKDINIELLKHNGEIYFINRNVNKIKITSNRPLTTNKIDLRRLYEERIKKYRKCADYIIKNDKEIEDAVKMILKERKV